MSVGTRAGKISKWFLLSMLVLVAGLEIDWRPKRVEGPPAVVHTLKDTGELKAGAAKSSLVPPFPTPMGGYNTRGNDPYQGVSDPVSTRALILEIGGKRLGFVSAELVVLPAPLRAKVLAAVSDLKLDELFIGATHTHASVGGYWDRRIAGWIGLGTYDSKIESFLVTQLSAALHEAAQQVKPAKISSGRIETSNYQANRHGMDIVADTNLTAVRIDALDDTRIARLVVYAVHPTITPRDSLQLSGDWPGAMMTTLEEDGAPALFFQGAVGDVTWGKRKGEMSLEERALRFGRAIAGEAKAASAAGGEGTGQVEVALARVRVNLPPADASGLVPPIVDRPVSNLLHWLMWPGTTEVTYLRLGPVTFAMLPGELVSKLNEQWKKLLGANIVSLVDDYVGYIETPEFIHERIGEAPRSYFGPALAPVLLEGLQTAKAAVDGQAEAKAP